jgi:hypothetical protein
MSAVELRHAAQPTVHPLQEYVLSLESESRWQPRIFDRWHLGQWVYPRTIVGRRDGLTDAQLLWIELFLMSRGAYLILLTDKVDSIVERVDQDDDSYLRHDDVATCVGNFYEAWYRSILPGIVTDLPNADPEFLVKSAMRTHFSYCGMADAPKRVIGNTFEPDAILVGDELGKPNPPEATHQVPFAAYGGASGHVLMSALLATRLTRRIALVNSLTPEGEVEDFHHLRETYPRARFVALGNEARARMLSAFGAETFSSVPHPQYVRRFRYGQLFRYAASLEVAVFNKTPVDMRKVWEDA